MGKGGASQMEVTDYRMSIHWGICHGPVDAFLGIYVGEKEAWSGEVTENTLISVSKPDLFGGVKKEGGCVGSAQYLAGADDQVMPEVLAAKLGRSSDTCPAYRGISSVFLYGTGLDLTGDIAHDLPVMMLGGLASGFLWGSNNPYLRDIWFKVRRSPKGLDARYQAIGRSMSIAVSGNTVSINGASDIVTQGTPQDINGSVVLLDGQSLTVDGTVIVVDLDAVDGAGHSAPTVSIGGVSGDLPPGSTTLSVNGWNFVLNGHYTVSSGGPSTTIANYTVSQGTLHDANPAAIIYECLTNSDWGMGGSPSSINTTSFTTAADTLLAEGFGLFMTWNKQTTIEAFVQEVLDHIQATLFVNPADGLWTLKLIRGDYDFDSLPQLNPDNCRVVNFQRKGWGETTNEIVVTWTNPDSEAEETVTAQNLANIQIQGAVISDSRNYYGVRTSALALQLAKRDLASVSAPLAAFDLEIDRSAWAFVPGGCARLTWPEEGIEDLVIRFGKIDYGKSGDPTIKVPAVEDIFSLPVGAYHTPTGTSWADTITAPQPMNHVRVLTAPAYFALRERSDLAESEVLAAILASQDNSDAHTYELISQTTLPNGDIVGDAIGTRQVLGFTTLSGALVAEASTVIPDFGTLSGGLGPAPGGFLFIGNAAEDFQEIALIQSYTAGSGWLLQRGVLDTVPRPWAAGTQIWFVRYDAIFLDSNNVRAEASTARYKMLAMASGGILAQADAPIIGTVLTGRPHLPSRPANVKVSTTAFGAVDLSAGSPTTIPVTWANRNRLVEDSQVLTWTDGDVVPETGQTTTIKVVALDGTVLTTHDGLTGTSFNVPVASFGGAGTADIVVTAKRDGLESLQGHVIRVTVSGSPPTGGSDPGTPTTGGAGGGDPSSGTGWNDVPSGRERYGEVYV